MRRQNHYAIDALAAAVSRAYMDEIHLGNGLRTIKIKLYSGERFTVDIYKNRNKNPYCYEFNFDYHPNRDKVIVRAIDVMSNISGFNLHKHRIDNFHGTSKEDISATVAYELAKEFAAMEFSIALVDVIEETKYIVDEYEKMNPVVKNPRVRRPTTRGPRF